MNRTIKDATVKRYYYQSHDHLKRHLHTFLMAYNFAKRLKTLKGLTPYEYICKIWTNEPQRFNLNPFQHNVGLNTRLTHATGWEADDRQGDRETPVSLHGFPVFSPRASGKAASLAPHCTSLNTVPKPKVPPISVVP